MNGGRSVCSGLAEIEGALQEARRALRGERAPGTGECAGGGFDTRGDRVDNAIKTRPAEACEGVLTQEERGLVTGRNRVSTRERRPPGRPRIAGNEAATEIIQALARAAPDLPATPTMAEAVRGLMAWLGCSRRTGYRILERAARDGVITLCDGGLDPCGPEEAVPEETGVYDLRAANRRRARSYSGRPSKPDGPIPIPPMPGLQGGGQRLVSSDGRHDFGRVGHRGGPLRPDLRERNRRRARSYAMKFYREGER